MKGAGFAVEFVNVSTDRSQDENRRIRIGNTGTTASGVV